MTNNDWNQNQPQDPNAPQGQDGWNQPTQQGWDANAPQQSWDANAQQQGWDANAQQQGWDANAPQQQSWDANAQQGWNQAGAQQGYDPAAVAWDPNAHYGAGAPGIEAGAGKRLLGALLDYVAPLFVISILSSLIFPQDTSTSMSGGSASYAVSGTGGFFTVVLTVALWAGLAYYASKNNGQTWGRKVAKTRILGADGQVPSFGQLFIRNIAHILDNICLVGWIVGLATKQTFADRIMKTRVYEHNN